jgi:hypothetical protein
MTRNRSRRPLGAIAVVAVLAGVSGLALDAARSAAIEPSPTAATPNSAAAVPTAASARPSSVAAAVPVDGVASDAATPTIDSSVAPSVDAIRPGSVTATSMNLSAEYSATVRLNFGTRAFRVDEAIVVTNTSGAAIDRLELNTVVARLGGMRIASASVDGATVHPTFTDQTIHFPLGGILDPGATATVRLGYRATLGSTVSGSTWLFTRANGVLEAYRWLPWISKPIAFDRPNHGDPFVTGVSPRVRVTIISDRVLRYATTGNQVGGSGLTKRFEARNVRDFAFTAAPDYALRSTTVGSVVIHVWSRPGFPAATVLAAARTALLREAALLGAYPYSTYDVAQTAGGYGMESPGLTWIPTGAGNLPYLVAHETGHQWFYGIVGNNQATEPYADEAATDFVARYVLGLRRASRCSTAELDLSIYRYSSACYYEDIYIQGGNFLDDTRKKMGSTAFWAGIRDYLATNRFKIAGTKTLLATLDAHTSLDLVPRYHARFPRLF